MAIKDHPITDIRTLSPKSEKTKPYRPTKHEIDDYFKRHPRLRRTPKNVDKAKTAIKKRQAKKDAPIGKDVSGSDPSADWQIIYGTMRVGGIHTFIHTISNNQYLLMVHTLAGHEINAVTGLFFDNTQIIFSSLPGTNIGPSPFDGKVYMQINYGSATQTALSQLIADAPDKWTVNHKQSGRAHVYLKLKWDGLAFPNGLPEIHFEVQGKKLYDPRTGITAFSSNSALCIYDYLTDTSYGMAIPSTDIDVQSFKDAADICDQAMLVFQPGTNIATTEPRFSVNGAFGGGQNPETVIQNMLSTMSGYLAVIAGKFTLLPGVWRAPTISLTETDILSPISLHTKISRSQNFNAVKGTYTAPTNNWEESDFPAVTNNLYQTEDGGQVFEDISLPFTTSAASAQRLAKIELERIRQGIEVSFTAGLSAFRLQVGDNCNLSVSRFGWVNKTFEVQRTELLIDSGANGEPIFVVQLSLRENASGIYNWGNGAETTVDLAKNTTLPSPLSITTPLGLALYAGSAEMATRSDGTFFRRIRVTWSAMPDFFVSSGGSIEIQFKLHTDSLWTNVAPVPGDLTQTYINNVRDGAAYDVRIRAVSALGIASGYSQILSIAIPQISTADQQANFVSTVRGFAPKGFFVFGTESPIQVAVGGTVKFLNCAQDTTVDPYYGATIALPIGPIQAGVGNGLWIPLLITESINETFDSWWTSHGWNTLQDAINQGATLWPDPSPINASDKGILGPGSFMLYSQGISYQTLQGYFECVVNNGTLLGSSFINWTWNETLAGDQALIVPTISTSVDGISWTDFANTTQVFATNYQYIKLHLDFYWTTSHTLSVLSEMLLTVSLQESEEAGICTCTAFEPNPAGAPVGTQFNFAKQWYKIESIMLTTESLNPQTAVLKFTDTIYPTTFNIILYDNSGARTSGTVRYRVKGGLVP